ncbi:MAG: aminotransferase class IV [Chitinivibrionales bacterium]|nr:aminotransferase class IV [Chitinivibrionales bacterium]
MAKFEGITWASKQMRYSLTDKQYELLGPGQDRVFSVSRSIHYGLFLAFEGIRFYCRKENGKITISFLNLDKNLNRFRNSIAFNLSAEQQSLVPSIEEMENIFVHRYFQEPSLREFLTEMAQQDAQGYLRPFTIDEEQSIGVTFPAQPAIRAVFSRYDRYLGEPFCGVVVPNLVRAVGVNKTGCLKLGTNYLMSVKAVDAAKKISSDAAAALFLDDNPGKPISQRLVTEWDSSCCLFALTNGTVIKIPENNLILPSVTIQGIVAILKKLGVPVEERYMTYGELLERSRKKELVTVCSIGTAGILNRCQKLVLVDENSNISVTATAQNDHPLFVQLGRAKEYFWNVYKRKAEAPDGVKLSEYTLK